MAGRLRVKQIPTLRPGRHGDGGTLYLVVEPGGHSRHWVQRLTVDGKRRDLGLGGYPYVGLAEARTAAFSNRQLARRGGDPTAAPPAVAGPDLPHGVRAGRCGGDLERTRAGGPAACPGAVLRLDPGPAPRPDPPRRRDRHPRPR